MQDGLDSVEVILWDIDGTLFSSEDIIHQVYRRVIQESHDRLGRPARVPELSEILAEVGKPVKEIFRNLLPDLSESERDVLGLRILHGLVTDIMAGKGEHYAEVHRVLSELHRRGYVFLAASNGRFPYIEAILRATDSFQFFKRIDCVDNRQTFNKVELVRYTLAQAGFEPRQAVLIGDRESDRQAALQNEIPFIATTFGHGSESEWRDAVARIDSLPDLLNLLPDRKA